MKPRTQYAIMNTETGQSKHWREKKPGKNTQWMKKCSIDDKLEIQRGARRGAVGKHKHGT